MRDADRFKLLGKYRTPRVRVGRVLTCEARDCDVVVTGFSDSRIPWPKGRVKRRHVHGQELRSGGPGGLIVFGALAEAVRRESNQAVAYWFGVNPNTVTVWRKALEVRRTNEGTHELRRAHGAEEWFTQVRAKGQAARWTPARRAEMSEEQARWWTDERRAEWSAKMKGRTYSPQGLANIRTGLKRRKYKMHPPEVRAKMRASAAARLARGVVPNGRAWTAAEDEFVRTLSAPEAAERTGRPIAHVYKRRRKLRVPDGRREKGA
jgi:hypothetical protein